MGIVMRDRRGRKGTREAINNLSVFKAHNQKGCCQDEGASSVGRRGKPYLKFTQGSTNERVGSSQESTVFRYLSTNISEKFAQNAADLYSGGRVENSSGEKGEVQRNGLHQAPMAAFPREEDQRAQEEKC